MATPLDPFLLTRVLLRFPTDDDDVLGEISAVHLADDGSLWVGADQGRSLWRLEPDRETPHVFGNARRVALDACLHLPGDDDELDIEGMDATGGHLWLVGSHSATREKATKGMDRVAEVRRRAARHLIARIPIDGTEGGAAVLRSEQEGLTQALHDDPNLGAILAAGIPAKDNGFDIEGLAVEAKKTYTRVHLGLRGPVLNGWAVLLELEVEEREPGRLVPRARQDGRLFRKRLLDLDGFGIRELQRVGHDLLVLAGPTMKHAGRMRVFRLHKAHKAPEEAIAQGKRLRFVFDLPLSEDGDKAEGLTLYPCFDAPGLLVGYDSPRPERRPDANSVFFDVYRLPE